VQLSFFDFIPPALKIAPMPIGLAGAGSSVKQVLLDFVALVQSVAAIIWTPQIYSISTFSLCFGVSTVN